MTNKTYVNVIFDGPELAILDIYAKALGLNRGSAVRSLLYPVLREWAYERQAATSALKEQQP